MNNTYLSGKSVDVFALHADGHQIPIELSLSTRFEVVDPMFGALIQDITGRRVTQQHLSTLPIVIVPALTQNRTRKSFTNGRST